MEECTLCTVCILKEINLDVRASLKKRKLRKNIYTELRRQGFILRLRQVYKEFFTYLPKLFSKVAYSQYAPI